MQILIITGACGVGKSTMATAWAKHHQGAIIECDFFTEWIFNEAFKQEKEEEEILVANLTIDCTKRYLEKGMSVAIENVWTPQGMQILVDQFSKIDVVRSIKVVWLYCERTENHRRDQLRVPENQMRGQLDIVNDELASYNWPDYVHKIDSTELSVAETLAVLMRSGDLYY